MKLDLSLVPVLRLCPVCQLHGHFTIPPNDYSLEFCNIRQGLEHLAAELHNPLLTAFFIKSLKRKILNCGLAEDHNGVPDKMLWTVSLWNEEHGECRANKIILQYTAHETISQPDFHIEIPEGYRESINAQNASPQPLAKIV